MCMGQCDLFCVFLLWALYYEQNLNDNRARGGGLVVSVPAFYYNDPSSNPPEVFSFYVKRLNRAKVSKKRPH